MNEFKCKICNQKHILQTLIEFPQPKIIGEITRGELNKSLNVLAKSIFLVGQNLIVKSDPTDPPNPICTDPPFPEY
jgi:hypothetical protein